MTIGIVLIVLGVAFVLFSTRITQAGIKRSQNRLNRGTSGVEKSLILVCFIGGGTLMCAAGIWFIISR